MNKKTHKTMLPEEFNKLIDELDECGIAYKFTKLACSVAAETASYIYEVDLTGENHRIINVGTIGNKFYKKTKMDVLEDKYGYDEYYTSVGKKKVHWDYEVACGYFYTDDYWANKPLKCWSYDINSAFAYAMLSQMPDTSKEPKYDCEVGKNEIGFYKSGEATTKVGEIADIVFPLMDSPFKEYVMECYNNKKNAKSKEERAKWKDFLNIPTGLVARKNVFIRNAIIHYSNEYIKSWIDENTVYCNVDCIVSLKPRPDIPVGDEIGMFKCEHECEDFKYLKRCEYQWGDECHYSGIPKSCITDIGDIEDWQSNTKYHVEGKKVYEKKKQAD